MKKALLIYSAKSENTLLIYCADFSLHWRTKKKSVKILEKIIPFYLHNISTPILEKHGQLNPELKALKICILKIEAQISALKNYVKRQLSLMAKQNRNGVAISLEDIKFSARECK